jgi:hypothetical protein
MRSLTVREKMSDEKKVTDQYIELYKLAVEMADRVSDRRASLLSLPFTANIALFAVLFGGDFRGGMWIVAMVGMIVSVTWWALTKSYRDLNAAKFKVIMAMEENLEVPIFNHEWAALKESYGYRPSSIMSRFTQFHVIERLLPPIFAVLYLAVLVDAWL